MNWFIDIITNPYLITTLSSWFIAQVLKVIIHSINNKKFDISRLYGDGGMPSGHSATVSSLVMITGLTVGFDTFEFAIAFVLALIVCHDATGVRRETGKQALLLKEIIKSFEVFSTKKLPEVMLKEFVGHTPVQVFAGILVGIVNAMILQFLVFI